jgi:hypothetical protein
MRDLLPSLNNPSDHLHQLLRQLHHNLVLFLLTLGSCRCRACKLDLNDEILRLGVDHALEEAVRGRLDVGRGVSQEGAERGKTVWGESRKGEVFNELKDHGAADGEGERVGGFCRKRERESRRGFGLVPISRENAGGKEEQTYQARS